MVRENHAATRSWSFTAEEIKQLKTFNSLIENDVITRRENKESGKYGRKWLSQSQPLFSPIYSALSNPNGAPGWRYVPSQPMNYWQPKATMKDLSLMFLVILRKPLMKGRKRDGWSGRDVGLATDQKVLEDVFKGEYTFGQPSRRPCIWSELISWPSWSQSPLSTSLKIQTVPRK